ncbi:MAG: hypothetical protein ACI9S7_002017 [Candidatus Paceibacteria bacterium]
MYCINFHQINIGDSMSNKKGLDPLKFGLLETPLQIDNKITGRAGEEYQRMVVIADSLGLGTSVIDWYQVALKLAKEHVPELKEHKPAGAKSKWGKFEKMMLAGEIYRLQTTGLTIDGACGELSKEDVWKGFLDQKESTYGSDPKAALFKQYKANKPERGIDMKAYLFYAHADDMDGWQKELALIKKK